MEVTVTCPLGAQCEEIKDNRLHRCAWYVKLQGIDKQGNEHDRWDCAIAWGPVLHVEMAGTNRHQTAAIESMRNETIKRQEAALKVLENAKTAQIK